MCPPRSLVAAGAWLTLLGLGAVPTAPARAAEELVPGSARVQAKARAEGKVSVIVRLKALDGVVGRADVRAQARARDELRGRLAVAGVASVRPVGRGPFAALEVDARLTRPLS